MSDTVKPDLVLSQLEVEEAGPYVVGLSGGKKVTFPDPGVLHAFEADEFMQDIGNAQSADAMFGKWLSEADVKKLKEEKGFTLYKMKGLLKKVQAHYQEALGPVGEEPAS